MNDPTATPGCFRSSNKIGPCVRPGPVLSPRAEDVWGVFSESFSSVVGMGLGMAPNRAAAATMAPLCGIATGPEFWMLYGDLERAWITFMSEGKPADE